MVSQWCHNVVPTVSQWCPNGVPMASQWRPNSIAMAYGMQDPSLWTPYSLCMASCAPASATNILLKNFVGCDTGSNDHEFWGAPDQVADAISQVHSVLQQLLHWMASTWQPAFLSTV